MKSLVAIVLSILAVVGAWLWYQDRTGILASMRRELAANVAIGRKSDTYAVVLEQLRKRHAVLQQDLKDIKARFVEKDNEGPILVAAVVKAASNSGMKVTGTAGNPEGNRLNQATTVEGLHTVAYKFSLIGSYSGLVKFFQEINTWDMHCGVESIEISPCTDEETDAEVSIDLILSLCSLGT